MSKTALSIHVLLPLLVALTLCLGQTPAQAGQPKVELYMTSWCPYCKKAEAFFKSKGIAYTTYDIEKDTAALARFQKYHVQGVPLVIIGGTTVAGYSIEEYERALEKK